MLSLVAIGLWQSLRRQWYATTPLWITTVILLLGHVVYRQTAPYSSSQDFRYSILLLVPFAYFLIVGLETIPKGLRKPARYATYTFIALCASFLIILGGSNG